MVDLDPTDRRIAAVNDIVRLLAGEPCTTDDVVTAVSFTTEQVVTGPSRPGALGRINRAIPGGTDIAAAVDVAVDLAAQRPGFRHIVVLVTDLEDGSGVPTDITLGRLAGFEPILISIGDSAGGSGVAQIRLLDTADITRHIADAINESRQR